MSDRLGFLIVEDNELDAENLSRCFEGLELKNPRTRAKDGVDALDVLRGTNGKQKLEKPYIVLLDINMPRMNGLEFLKEVRADKELCDISVFILSTSDRTQDIEDAYKYNVAGYFVKPLDRKEMQKTLGTLVSFWELSEHMKIRKV